MTNSKNIERVTGIIEQILELTDEEYLQSRIDKPVENMLAAFEYDINAQISHRYFMDTISDFVRNIYLHNPGISQDLSRSQASAEALSIIEKAFGSNRVQGYDAAIVDAYGDFESILTGIAGFIITRTREKHIRWVYSICIDPFDWPTRCTIAEILIKMFEPFLPSSILSCSPSQLADVLPQLFDTVRATESIVRKTMNSDMGF